VAAAISKDISAISQQSFQLWNFFIQLIPVAAKPLVKMMSARCVFGVATIAKFA
jgi:hypothetical protein